MNKSRPDDRFDELMRQAMHCPPPAEPPPDFAKSMASLVADAPEKASMEILATRLVVGLCVLAAVACALFALDLIASRIGPVLERVPWPLLITSAVVFGAIKLVELRGVPRRGHDPG